MSTSHWHLNEVLYYYIPCGVFSEIESFKSINMLNETFNWRRVALVKGSNSLSTYWKEYLVKAQGRGTNTSYPWTQYVCNSNSNTYIIRPGWVRCLCHAPVVKSMYMVDRKTYNNLDPNTIPHQLVKYMTCRISMYSPSLV